MTVYINGTTGISGVDGSAGTPAVQGTDTNTGVFYPAADTVGVSTGGSERMRVDSSGNVGIGTSPASTNKLQVSSAGTTRLYVENTANNVGVRLQTLSNAGLLQTDTNHPLTFATNNGAEAMRIDTSGNLLFNSGYGSVATAYGCRAWVNFNGTGTVAIRASGNVSSITDNGTGNYTVNFSTAMTDANYCVTGTASRATLVAPRIVAGSTTVPATGSVRIQSGDDGGTANDCEFVNIAIFR